MEHAHALDRPVGMLAVAVRRGLRPGRVKDVLHGVPLGHPAHPVLTDLPIGCWVSAAVLDLLPGTERASRLLISAGLAATLPTALTGLADWSALHPEQQRVGFVHAVTNAAATALYAGSVAARGLGRHRTGKALAYAGLTVVACGGYLGAHLAFRQAAGANHTEQVAHLVGLGWHDLCPLSDLPDSVPVRRALGYIELFVLRQDSSVAVLADRCAHLAGPLHRGRLVGVDGQECVVCPWHGSTFRIADGTVVHGPATARQPSFETRVLDDGMVQVRPRA